MGVGSDYPYSQPKTAPPPEPRFPIPYKAVAAALIRHMNIHEGHWQVYAKFERNAQYTTWNGAVVPTCAVGVTEFGLVKVDDATPISCHAPDVWAEPEAFTAPIFVVGPPQPREN